VLFVNNPKFLDEAYRRFIINRFRELLPFPEVPMHLLVRGRLSGQRGLAKSLDETGENDDFDVAKDDDKSAPKKRDAR
jgi:GTPase